MASCRSCSCSRSVDSLSVSNSDSFSLLHRCTNLKHLTQIHAKLIRSNSLSTHNPLLATNLLRLYASHGRVDCATAIFKQMQDPSTFAWNLMIRAHTLNGSSHQAIVLYILMLCSGVLPDKFTIPFVIKACSASRDIEKGRVVHGLAVKTGYYGRDMFVKNTIMDMYLKCRDLECALQVLEEMPVRNVVSWTTMLSGLVSYGELDFARRLLDQMPEKNVVSWTAMIDGYVAKGRPQEAFELFSKMQANGVKPNEFTLVCLLRACTQLGSVKLGAWVHEYALINGFELGTYLGTALVDMYSKCSSLDEATKVFDSMEKRSLATWNSMITSLGVHGCGEEALALFERMMEENIVPDAITFVGVLSACVQTQKVDEGLEYFKYMTGSCGIMPVLEHYVCMFELWALERSRREGQSNVQKEEVESISV